MANARDVFHRKKHVARRLEVVAVAGLLWISCCVLGGADLFVFYFRFSFSQRTRPAASMRPPCLIYFSTITWYEL